MSEPKELDLKNLIYGLALCLQNPEIKSVEQMSLEDAKEIIFNELHKVTEPI